MTLLEQTLAEMGRVFPWEAIEPEFTQGLILGNGASIAFDPRFAYHSLTESARERGLITPDVQRVFDHLETTDFEWVLRMLWHASEINRALEIPDARTTKAYVGVRDALIQTVGAIHVAYEEVRDRLPAAATFMSHFSTVISLSYDLLVYWAILVGNEGAPNRMKDCFINSEFQHTWRTLREPWGTNRAATLVFYPHGNLAVGADLDGTEYKVRSNEGETLLRTIFQHWAAGELAPVFVSEGTSGQKHLAIRRSPYLSRVYDEVLPELGQSLVVLGWSMQDNDDHLLDAICRGRIRRVAVAVDPASQCLVELHAAVSRKLTKRLGPDRVEVVFFDRGSHRCWVAS